MRPQSAAEPDSRAPRRPPTVELLTPGRDGTAAPGGDVAATVRAGDDHGLGQVRLEMKVRNEDSPAGGDDRDSIVVVKTWTPNGADARRRRAAKAGSGAADQFKPGQTVMLRGVALDRREVFRLGARPRPARDGRPLAFRADRRRREQGGGGDGRLGRAAELDLEDAAAAASRPLDRPDDAPPRRPCRRTRPRPATSAANRSAIHKAAVELVKSIGGGRRRSGWP